MDNHIHLTLRPLGEESLSRILQWILSCFAVQYNSFNNISGHLWQDRYKSKIMDDIKQFLATLLYVSQNPVMAGLARKASAYGYVAAWHICKDSHGILDPPIPQMHIP
jgi:REP element-mobilizing transposase RayT